MLNLVLFKLGIFNIDLGTIISFIVGVVIGVIIVLLSYLLVVANSLRTKDFIIKTDKDDLTTQEVKQMILDTQSTYKDKSLRQDTGRVTYCEGLSKDLCVAIASRFYPESKYPILELSVNEITLLITYVTNRINEILNRRAIRLVRKLKVSTVYDFLKKKKQLEENKAFKTTVEIGGKLSKVKKVLNVINPALLIRNHVVNNIINVFVDKICLAVIGIVGEETYKIYSKKVFNQFVEIDSGTDKIIEEFVDDINNSEYDLEDLDDYVLEGNFKSKIYQSEVKEFKVNGYKVDEPVKKKIN